MFYNCKYINKINFIKNNNNITDISFMFYERENLTELDLSQFKTNNVTNMNEMFYEL